MIELINTKAMSLTNNLRGFLSFVKRISANLKAAKMAVVIIATSSAFSIDILSCRMREAKYKRTP